MQRSRKRRNKNSKKKRNMKRLLKPALLAVVTALLAWLPLQASAQQQGGGGGGGGGRGTFDPEQMRQRMMERYREQMDVKDDAAWQAIETRITKVMEARRDVGFGGGMRGMFGPRRGGGDNQGGDQPQRRRGGFGQPSPAAEDLQKAIDAKASNDTIKAKLAAYRDERKQKQADLQKAQDDLRKVLNVKQEAVAVLAGLLD